MSYSITDNTAKFDNEITMKANVFLRLLAESIVNIAEPKTPKKRGNLRGDVLREVLGLKGKVKWNKNYAIYQETKQYKNYTTAGTGAHFAENAVNEAIKNTGKIAKNAGLV